MCPLLAKAHTEKQSTPANYCFDKSTDAGQRRAERELTEADRDHRREQASEFQKQDNSIRQRVRPPKKAQVKILKRRVKIEERMRQW
jgi:hypothetical protein